jgi:1-deoxy-D-xylulose-5-phosphate reductoisomerase
MRIPIHYALGFPERRCSTFPRLDLARAGTLTFRTPPPHYRALDLAYEVLRRGGTAGAVFNAADEVAVAAFLDGQIPFPAITDIVAETLARHATIDEPSLDDIVEQDAAARAHARKLVQERERAREHTLTQPKGEQ